MMGKTVTLLSTNIKLVIICKIVYIIDDSLEYYIEEVNLLTGNIMMTSRCISSEIQCYIASLNDFDNFLKITI